MTPPTITEYRVGRNYIRTGDVVACKPLKGHRFLARVVRIDVDDDGKVASVNVCIRSTLSGGRHHHAGSARAFPPDRINRVAQTRIPEMKEDFV